VSIASDLFFNILTEAITTEFDNSSPIVLVALVEIPKGDKYNSEV